MKDVQIYTVDYCPYCRGAINYLKKNNIDFKQVKIDNREEEMKKEIAKQYNIKGEVTLPQIIIDGVRIGGYSDMLKLARNGELKFD